MRRLATRVKRSFANLQAQAGAASPPADRPPAQEPDCVARPPVPSDSGLESLPPEVTRQIMALLPLADVKAIVFASPVFYHQYRFDRKYILCRALEQTLGPACREAYAAYQCGAALERIPTVVQEAVQSYSSMSPCHSIYNVSTEEEAVGMASFYLKTVQPVVGYYGRWALDNLSKHTGRHPHYQTVQMTSTEIMRITGAAYRFQILCHVLDNRSPDDTVNTYFTCLEGWEADQVLAFYQFIRRMIKDTFEKIKEDLHPKHARFKDQGPYPSPQEAFQLDLYPKSYIEGTALFGKLDLLRKMYLVRGHEELVVLMQRHIKMSTGHVMSPWSGLFDETSQVERQRNDSIRRQRLLGREPFPFLGECQGPPLAWSTIWEDKYSNLYGFYTSAELRYWGYIFWDAATLNSTGAMKVLQEQWSKRWDGLSALDHFNYFLDEA